MLYPDFIKHLEPYILLQTLKHIRLVSKFLSRKITKQDIIKKQSKLKRFPNLIQCIIPYLQTSCIAKQNFTSELNGKDIIVRCHNFNGSRKGFFFNKISIEIDNLPLEIIYAEMVAMCKIFSPEKFI